MDPPTNFHSKLGFLENKCLCKAPYALGEENKGRPRRRWLDNIGEDKNKITSFIANIEQNTIRLQQQFVPSIGMVGERVDRRIILS